MPLKILSYDELYGWTMDAIVAQIGKRNNCTFCGVFRRQALDRGAALLNVDHIVTGHNADDIAETVLMNSESGCNALARRMMIEPVFFFQSCAGISPVSDVVLPSAHRGRTRSNGRSLSSTHMRRKS